MLLQVPAFRMDLLEELSLELASFRLRDSQVVGQHLFGVRLAPVVLRWQRRHRLVVAGGLVDQLERQDRVQLLLVLLSRDVGLGQYHLGERLAVRSLSCWIQ